MCCLCLWLWRGRLRDELLWERWRRLCGRQETLEVRRLKVRLRLRLRRNGACRLAGLEKLEELALLLLEREVLLAAERLDGLLAPPDGVLELPHIAVAVLQLLVHRDQLQVHALQCPLHALQTHQQRDKGLALLRVQRPRVAQRHLGNPKALADSAHSVLHLLQCAAHLRLQVAHKDLEPLL